MKGFFPVTGSLLLLLIGPGLALAANLVAEGRQDAVLECAACHRVTILQKPPAPVPDLDEGRAVTAPAFDVIARRYAGRPRALRAFIQAPRHPMHEQQFLSRDLTAIGRYIASLRDERW